MAKLTLTDLASLENGNTAVTAINNNHDAIIAALDNTLSRDGTSPNTMNADLDMNSHSILNVVMTLPTSDPGVAGKLWNNNGVVNISAG